MFSSNNDKMEKTVHVIKSNPPPVIEAACIEEYMLLVCRNIDPWYTGIQACAMREYRLLVYKNTG